MAKKLTKAQQRVVDLMRNGWELGCSHGIHSYCWLQHGGCGKGGDSERVNANTLGALEQAGVVVLQKYSFPTSIYRLGDGFADVKEE